MKKGLIVSLLLIGIFLIGNTEMAVAQCLDYQCTENETQYGQFVDVLDTCVSLCPDSQYPYYLAGYIDYEYFAGYLYPAAGSKKLLGTADTYYGWAGCSLERSGRSIIVILTYIEEGAGYIDTLRCTPSNEACPIISDRRLKKSIKEVKGIYNQIGLKMYTWQWTEKAERLFGLKGYSAGVIAQEVKEKYPDAVVEYKGYLTVRYGYLNRLLLMQEG